MIPETLQLSKLAKTFKPGVYRHYKGELYNAMFVAKNSEHHEEEYVIYRSIQHGYICARPVPMFLETVKINNETKPRFEWVREME